MPVIGTFTAVKDGYAGTIRTLTLNARVNVVANDDKESDKAPDFRILAGGNEIGAAWRRTKQGTEETYLTSSSMIPLCRNRSGPRCSKRPTTASPGSSGGATSATRVRECPPRHSSRPAPAPRPVPPLWFIAG